MNFVNTALFSAILTGLGIFMLSGCTNSAQDSPQTEPENVSAERYTFTSWSPQVEFAGALRNIMRQNNLSAHLHFNGFDLNPNVYALGAFENLKGEILILRGTSFSNRAVGDEAVIIDLKDEAAAFMVWAEVEDWQGFPVADSVRTFAQLETFAALQAETFGLDTRQPFPFGLTGTAAELVWHVIDWPEDDPVHTHEKHMVTGPHGVLTNIPVEVLGFYSDSHHGIFTHHSTNMHLHFVSHEENEAGHVDDITLSSGATLWLPAR
ncbi:MAG: acetolactate decarboxylase [Balneolales bacterium]|nr:acetolactate decarboxylase [Balneolales bacterium]